MPGRDLTIDELMQQVYQELHALAERSMRHERPDHTLQPSALVNEVYLRLGRDDQARWQNRAHFLAAAARAIRRILVEHARRRGAIKRAGDRRRIRLDDALALVEQPGLDVLEVDAALEELARFDRRLSEVVQLRFFGGLTVDEVADVIGLSKRTVESDWTVARAWLRRRFARETAS